MTTWVILAGLPATGKSTLARALASRLDAVILDKDGIRQAIFGDAFTDHTREQDDVVVRAMIESAKYLTEHKRAEFILFDGRTFSKAEQIDEVLKAANGTGAASRILNLRCSDQAAGGRLQQEGARHPARNRDLALYRQLQQASQPIPYAKLDIDTTFGFETELDAICNYLRGDHHG
jgi:predicted kinase